MTRPRLREKGRGANKEVPLPAYEAMQQETIGQRMLEILLQGVSTRRVCRWQPGMAARWSAAAFLEIEKSFRKIMGYRDL